MANVPQPGGQQPSASLVIFVRASDNRLVIKQWHSTLSVPNAISGQRQVFVNGAPQGQPAAFNRALSEWRFPLIEASPSDTSITGSSPAQADAGSAELVHHYGGMPPSATCQWQLTKGGNGGAPSGPTLGNGYPGQNPQTSPGNVGPQSNAQNCESPATVQQSFEAMKADIKSQYDKLIQGTSNPAEVASLTSQEQKTLASLNNQEQHDMTLASQGCLQATNSQGNNSYPGSSPNGGSSQYAGNNPNTGGAPNSGINPNNGVNPNGGSSQYAGNPNAGSAPSGSTGSTGQTSTPQLLSLSPTSVSQGSTIPVRLTGQGTHWQSQITNVSFGPQITVQSFIADSSGTSGTANIAVAADASTGARPVMLMTGAELVGLPSGLSVTASPSQQGSGSSGTGSNSGTKFGTPNHQVSSMAMLTGVSPATNNGQKNVTVTLTGQFTHFSPGATTVSFVRSATQPQGGSTSGISSNFKLQAAALGGNTPPSLQAGQAQAPSGTTVTVPLTINPVAAAGTYNITVTTPTANGTETLTLNDAFTVTSTPSFTGVNMIPVKTIAKNAGSTSTPAAPASANYLVTISGLLCTTPTTGGGDAVYAASFVRQYDRRNGQLMMFTDPQTWIYGNNNGMQDQRKQAGSRSSTGGIGTGDFIPLGFVPGIKDSSFPQVNLFPLTVWQGPLTDGVDALVISPSVWENYGDTPIFSTWIQNQTSFNNSLMLDSRVQNEISTQALGTVVLGSSENAPGSVTQAAATNAANQAYIVATAFGGPSSLGGGLLIEAIISAFDHPTHDRPIGLADANSTSVVFPNSAVVLTREIIEKRLGNNKWTTVGIDFKDTTQGLTGGDHPGEYTMFLQIERQ